MPPPLLLRRVYMVDRTRSWQVRVVGCGECGAKIASIFDKKPSFLPRRTEDLYPVRCVIVDTDPDVEREVQKEDWRWQTVTDIHILPVASSSVLTKRILGKSGRSGKDDEHRTRLERIDSSKGIGGFPYLGRVSAEEFLQSDTPDREDFKRSLGERGFIEGGLLTINSLSGGTGTGFSQVVSNFLVNNFGFKARLNLNLSIIPEGTLLPDSYPRTMLFCLYHLLQDNAIDGIILADNDVMRNNYGCKGNLGYNHFLHEILSPILLAPCGIYTPGSFGAVMDGNDIRRILRPKMAVDPPELCALSCVSAPVPKFHQLFFRRGESRKSYLQKYLENMVEQACSMTTTGEVTYGKSGLAVLCGPPGLYENVFDNNSALFTYLWQYLMGKISREFRLAALEFEDMEEVQLIILISGISSKKLEGIFGEVLLTHGGLPPADTLGQSIRKLKPRVVEDMMVKEIRECLLG
jgi:hypothetical protein